MSACIAAIMAFRAVVGPAAISWSISGCLDIRWPIVQWLGGSTGFPAFRMIAARRCSAAVGWVVSGGAGRARIAGFGWGEVVTVVVCTGGVGSNISSKWMGLVVGDSQSSWVGGVESSIRSANRL